MKKEKKELTTIKVKKDTIKGVQEKLNVRYMGKFTVWINEIIDKAADNEEFFNDVNKLKLMKNPKKEEL